ncbi:MAG: DUF1549 and DUF1553 domain-containing protein [Gemmataceae bacterium]|nr:DUF1549 and DUF1553 domain-containing protein [Gemmataceae bacterium]
MGSHKLKFLVLGLLFAGGALSLARAAEPEPKQEEKAAAKAEPALPAPEKPELVGPVIERPEGFAPAETLIDAPAMSSRIDQLIQSQWKAKGVTPAEAADDAEFFRRLSLHINGRIPTITQLKDFLDDTRADKKRIWTEELMHGRDNADLYVNHLSTFWRQLFFSQTNNQMQAQYAGMQLDPWFRNHVKNNTGYDKVVRELLTGQQYQQFAQANENKAETIAGNTARLFLGVKLECAQCHDDKSGGNWTRMQFWEYAAFFNRNGGTPPTIPIPDKKTVAQARFLDGTSPQWRGGANSQTVLADWMTSGTNPFFAKAVVNRMWHYFMGVGLVDPVDAASEENVPSHPELLDELARQFAAHNFDLKYLVRAITGTQAYQLTSARSHESQDDPRQFARFNVQGMTPEQLFDSISEATGFRDNNPIPNRFNMFGQPNTPRGEFIAKFSNPHDKRTETKTSILQALFLMNGKQMGDWTSLEKSKTLETVANAAASISTSRRIEELFIVTLSRKPRPAELERLVKYVDAGGPAKDPKKALADVFWALLNSGEFMLNH